LTVKQRSIYGHAVLIGAMLTVVSVVLSVLIRYVLDMELSVKTALIRAVATVFVAFPVSFLAVSRIKRLEAAYYNLLREARELAKEAGTDPLTGLLNRRSFEKQVNSALSWGPGGQFLIADIDYLKTINDVHGHIVGDDAILAVADSLAALLGPEALVARIGGDEFCALLPPGTIQRAEEFNARLNAAATAGFRSRSGLLTVSVEVSVATGNCSNGSRFRDIIASTDSGLYRKKRSRPALPERMGLHR